MKKNRRGGDLHVFMEDTYLCTYNIWKSLLQVIVFLKDLLCKIFISEFFVHQNHKIKGCQHTVLTGQCLLSKQCVPFLSLIGQCDTILGLIGFDIFYLACQIKKITMSKVNFWKFGGKKLMFMALGMLPFIGHMDQ